jgi:hypothetical protein
MVGGTCGDADGPEDVFYLISDIKSGAVGLRHLTLGEKGTDIVVRGDIEKFRLRAPGLRWPVFATADARAEFAALRGAGTLRLIDDRSSRLGVNRFEHVVRGGAGFSDTGISGFRTGRQRNRRNEVHEEAET